MSATVSAITAFQLTTTDPQRLARFYQELGFTLGDHARIPPDEIALFGLEQGGTRLALHVGEQRIDLDSFDDPGCGFPAASTSADLCFQHLALVTDDAAAAWALAAALGAVPISTSGPVRLPASDGGVTAVKFRDPEGHPLELLQFPPGAATPWLGSGLLGIDHSAISVANAEASRCFYEALGLSVGRPTLNEGPTQNVLDGLPQVIVDVLPMKPRRGTPHLELLGYRVPRGRPAGPLAANDVAATRIVWQADRDALLRDPDGHLHLLRAHPGARASLTG
jgi:catechol 2,3-dioxygenase-like lactoylglutathione lyase family enzyme